MILKNINIILLLCVCVELSAQIPDSISQNENHYPDSLALSLQENPQDTLVLDSISVAQQDSLGKQKKKEGFMYRLWREDYPNPKKALYMSFVVPGSGQIYNKRWWKLPIVYGGIGLTGFFIGYNQKRYKIFRDAYIAELNDVPHAYEGFYDAGDLKFLRDGFDQRRQWSWIGFFAFYLFQGAEAFVDAHLRTFDVSEDLSLKIQPTLQNDLFQDPTFGLALTLQLKSSKK